MKYFTFYRESNDFTDILTDTNLKKIMKTQIKWHQYLLVGIADYKNERQFSYITLKYGDDISKPITDDFTPVPYVDYVPKKDPSKFHKRSR